MQNNESYTSSPDTATQSIKKLPSDFHERLFECEMEMEKEDVDMEVVNDLLNLYARAIEYYESQQNERYLIFKNKTQALLMAPNVVKAMNQKTEEIRTKTEPDEVFNAEKEELSYSQQQNIKQNLVQQHKALQLKVSFIKQQDSQQSAINLIDQQNKIQDYNVNILKRDEESQVQRIEELRERVRQMNIEKNGFYSPKTYDKIISDVNRKSPRKRKINLFKIDCPNPPGSSTNLQQNPDSQGDNNLIDLNLGDDCDSINNNNNLSNNNGATYTDEGYQQKEESAVQNEDYDDEEEDIVFETQNTSNNNENNHNQYQLYSLNSQESPQNQKKFNLFNEKDLLDIDLQIGGSKGKNSNMYKTPHKKQYNNTHEINLIDFSEEKKQAQQKIHNQQKLQANLLDIDLNNDQEQIQITNNSNNINNNKIQNSQHKSNGKLIQQNSNIIEYNINNSPYTPQSQQQQQNSNFKTQPSVGQNNLQEKQQEMQIINQEEVIKQKKVSKKKSTNKKARHNTQENQTTSNFVIPF